MADNKPKTKSIADIDVNELVAQIEAKVRAELKEELRAEMSIPVRRGPSEEELKWANEKVTVRLYKDRGKLSDDVVVIVNGNTFVIQRGVEVEVPRYVADVLRNSDEQRGYAVDIMDKLESDYRDKSKELG